VVEGIMDLVPVWKVHENVTCTFGIQLTHRQKKLLKEFPDVVLMPDSDDGGERFIDIMDSFYEKEFFIAKVPEKDPGGSTEAHIVLALKNRRPVTQYLLEVTGELPTRERLLW
jgi:DNA primase